MLRRAVAPCAALALLVAMAVVARAEPAPPPRPRSAADVAGAPRPGEESGRVDPARDDDGSGARAATRAVLWIPRAALEVVVAPVRGGLWLYERYQVRDRARQIFFNADGTVGLFPVVKYESGFGVNGGARFVHKDLFGAGEQLRVRGGFGGRHRQIYTARLRSGRRLGDGVELDLAGELELRPKDRFFGIGDADALAEPPAAPLDARGGGAVEARFAQRILRVAAVAGLRLHGPLVARASVALLDRRFDVPTADDADGAAIDARYDLATLVGWDDGVRYAYDELELAWDARGPGSAWEPASIAATGFLARGFVGLATGIGGVRDHWRYGVDLQRFVRLGEGPRVLALRLFGEGVSGGRDEVPFTELPRLGGPLILRGYELDRFRDRIAAMASVEYRWDLSQLLSASLFVDAGRVFPSLDALGPDQLRVGYGAALEGHTFRSFIARLSVASSRDGGVRVDLALDPVYDPDLRVERK